MQVKGQKTEKLEFLLPAQCCSAGYSAHSTLLTENANLQFHVRLTANPRLAHSDISFIVCRA